MRSWRNTAKLPDGTAHRLQHQIGEGWGIHGFEVPHISSDGPDFRRKSEAQRYGRPRLYNVAKNETGSETDRPKTEGWAK